MKLKKFFAGVVAAAMMLTMGATAAFAATGTDGAEATTPTTTTITALGSNGKATTVENGGWFSIKKTYDEKAKTAGLYADNVVLVQDGDVVLSESNSLKSEDVKDKTLNFEASNITVANGVVTAGAFKVKLPEYTSVGKYTYTVKETAGNTAGVKYNQNTFKIVVLVTNADNGGFECHVSLRDANATENSKTDSILNNFEDNSLTVGKTVTGNLGDKNEYFTFTVVLNAPKNANNIYLDVNNLITVDASKADKPNVKFADGSNNGDATLTNGKLDFGTAKQVTLEITLKHNQSVEFKNIPVGVTYTVTENGAKKENDSETIKNGLYTVTYNGCEGSISADEASSATITNDYGNGNPDTGVILDNAPYIALMAIVVFGGVALMLNKRRRDEE